MSAMFTLAQVAYRFFEDQAETSTTAIAAQNTDITRATSSPTLMLRVQLDETGGVAGGATDDYQLQVSKNAGAYQSVTTTSTIVKAFASANLTDAAATTNGTQMTDSTGTFSGEVSEAGLVTDHAIPSGGYGEYLYTIELVSADLANGDTLDFRVLRNGATITYTVTPRITASVASALAGAAALSGAGTLAAAGLVSKPGAAALSGTGTLAANGSLGATTYQGAFAGTGAGTLAASAIRTISGSAAVSGSGSLVSSAIRMLNGALAAIGSGVVSATAKMTALGRAAVSSVGTLFASGVIEGAEEEIRTRVNCQIHRRARSFRRVSTNRKKP